MNIDLFNQGFHEYQQYLIERLQGEVTDLTSENLLVDDLTSSLVKKYTRVAPSIDWDSLEIIDQREVEEENYDRSGYKWVNKVTRCTFEAKYSGDGILFGVRPSTSRVWTMPFRVNDETISFVLETSNSPEQSKANLDKVKENVDHNLEQIARDIASYNNQLEGTVGTLVKRREEELKKHASNVNSFGVPIRKRDE